MRNLCARRLAVALSLGVIAQLVEHLLCKQGVVGSIPTGSTNGAISGSDGSVAQVGESRLPQATRGMPREA